VLLVASALAGLFALACTEGDTIVNSTNAGAPGITVNGAGRALGTPDVVFLQLGTNVEHATVAAAREAAAQAMQAVLNSLRANGVEDRNIQTTQFSIQPQYDFAGSTRTLRGYRVMNVVTAKITAIDSVNRVIDGAAAAGGNATTIQSITFAIDDPTKLQSEARQEAMAQAKARAEELAVHAGVQLRAPISITEGFQAVVPQVSAPRVLAPAAGDTSTPIQAGELEVVVNVTVLYGIE
jgi:uncharacterized protein YggE